jgi:NADH-quinone oxidoreductase subunit L
LVFHGKARWGDHQASAHDAKAAHHGEDKHLADDHHDDKHHDEHHHGLGPGQKPHESPLVVTLPLILLAIPSLLIGCLTIGPMLFGDFYKGVIVVAANHSAMADMAKIFDGWMSMSMHAFSTAPFWLMIAGIALSYFMYMVKPSWPKAIAKTFRPLYVLLDNKYYMDKFNEVFFAGGSRALGKGLWKVGDQTLIDGLAVNGSAKLVGWLSSVARLLQTGRMNNYAVSMIIGVGVLMLFVVLPLIRR